MTWPRPVRMVGVGSPMMGDDAVGWEVVRQLQARIEGFPGVEYHLVGGGQGLLDLLDGRGTIVLLDGIQAGAPPGTIHAFDWPDPRVTALRPGSTHQMNPAAALALAETLRPLPRVAVFGIEIDRCEVGEGLGPAVAAAVPLLTDRIAAELRPSEEPNQRPTRGL